MERIGKALSGASALTTFAASAMVLVLVCHVTLDVTLRYLFNAPLNATILFVSTFYMTSIAFLPLAAVEARDAHISVEVVSSLLPSWLERVLVAFGLVLTILVMAALALRGWEVAMGRYAVGAFAMESRVRVLTWPSYFLLPVGFGLMLLVSLHKLVCLVSGARDGLQAFLHLGEPGAPILDDRDRD